jgi:hypothetical protein
MPFSARQGFFASANITPPPTPPEWYELSNTEISTEISSWNWDGVRDFRSYDMTSTVFSTNGAYRGAVAAPNGNVYLAPSTKVTNNIVEYDPRTQTTTEKATGQTLTGALRYICGALGPDNKIYWPPFNMDKFLIYDVDADTFELQDWGLTFSSPAYEFAKFAGDKLYVIGTPANAIIVNVTANTAVESTLGLSLGVNSAKYVSGTRSLYNNKIYAAPYNYQNVLIIDPDTDTAEQQTWGITFQSQSSQFMQNAKNGNVYFGAHNNVPRDVYSHDPSANTTVSIGAGTKSIGGAMAPDGNLLLGAFGTPSNIDVTTDSISVNPLWMQAVYGNRWGIVSQGNVVLAFPNNTTNTHVVHYQVTGSGDNSTNVSKISWSNYFNGDR